MRARVALFVGLLALAAAAPAQAANIVVKQNTEPNGEQDFNFTAGGGLSPTSFQLDDDGFNSNGLANRREFSGLPAGSGYSVAQTSTPSGYDPTQATCSDGSSPSNIDLSDGEIVTCTFLSRFSAGGTITVVKDARPDSSQIFTFTANGPTPPGQTFFGLKDDGNPSSRRSGGFAVYPGTYSVTETVVPGWAVESSQCSDGSFAFSIDVAANENVVCTFVNVASGAIKVRLDSQPNDPQDFGFTAGGGLSPSTFTLDDDTDQTLSSQREFLNVAPRSGYSIAESVPPSWDLTSATCDDGSPVTNIDVGEGEIVTCTFTNTATDAGSVTIRKDAQPDSSQAFSFAFGFENFSLTDDGPGPGVDSMTFVTRPGTYQASESNPGSNWTQAPATCSDGSPVSAIAVSANEDITCTFVNVQKGTLRVVKDAVPNDPQDFTFTAGGGLSPSTFVLDDDSNGTFSSQRTFMVDPGSGYSLAETVPANWTQSSATCSDGSPLSNIDVSSGETVTCTFTNTATDTGTITVVKDARPDDPQAFSFNADPGLTPPSFSLADDGPGGLPGSATLLGRAGTHSVAEQVPIDWLQSSATCSDGSPASAVLLSAGEGVTCTFVNDRKSQIRIVKDAQPDSAQDFTFDTGGGLGTPSFVLDDDLDATQPQSRTFDVAAGSGYSVSERLISGWILESATCDNGSPVTDISVPAGQLVTCTFTNDKFAGLIVRQDTQPDDPQDYTFDATGSGLPPSFQLDDDGNDSNGLSSSAVFPALAAGTYSLAQQPVPGYDRANASCSDGSPLSAIDLTDGETVECTFSNLTPGAAAITVVKDAQPDASKLFRFNTTGLSPNSFVLDDDGVETNSLPSSRKLFVPTPGAGYSVSEVIPLGWDQTSASCSDGSPPANIDVSAGERLTCTFVNVHVSDPPGYARPKGATPFFTALVPAYSPCTSPNRVHQASLSFGSCNPPTRISQNLMNGSPDSNGAAANSQGFVKLRVLGVPGGPDDADVTIDASLTDVRCAGATVPCGSANAAAFPDYTGQLQSRFDIQITDRASSGAATVLAVPLKVDMPCLGTTSTAVGSTCSSATSQEAILPGSVPEGVRSIWELTPIQIWDGGPDGSPDTGNESLFAVQGVFVP